MRIALRDTFRYIHEPLRVDDDALSLLGNAELIDELCTRIKNSRGGAFLVAGFRGVGKSTIVLQALEHVRRASDPAVVVLPVVPSVARATSTDRLLFALVRRIFETLSDTDVLERLSPAVQQALLLAYMRTSLSFKETQTKSSEHGGSFEFGPGPAARSVARIVAPKVNLSAKRSRSLAMEASFLAYSETDVEHDLMRIIALLDQQNALARRRAFWRRSGPSRIRLVVVLDEVDKLTTGSSGLAAVEELLSGLKNVLTMAGAHFLLIAGPDLHDRAVKDGSRGNSVYESVFSWLTYVPCTWQAPHGLLDGLVAESPRESQADDLALFADYLSFKTRGVPRRLLQEFNAFIVWKEKQPLLHLDENERSRLTFYARLERILAEYFSADRHEQLFPLALDKDRRRLGVYYTVDWVVRSAGEPFTALDLVRQGEDAELDPLLQLPQRKVEQLLNHLVRHQVVDLIPGQGTYIPDVAEAQLNVYKLADNVVRTLLGFAMHNESERAALEFSQLSIVGDRSLPGAQLLNGRYERRGVIGRGGMGVVYRGWDLVAGRDVAIKVLHPTLDVNDRAVARFRREVSIASKTSHSQVVRVYDVVENPGEGLALVMELLPGPSLQEMVAETGPLSATEAARMGRTLADVLDYFEHLGVVRLDLKPSNVMMHPERGPVVIDLGLARLTEPDVALTVTGELVGTPRYIAPEQFHGLPGDTRTDIYALGLVLYFALTGTHAWKNDNITALLFQIVNEDPDVSGLDVSPQFQAAITKATARDPDQRFPHAADLRATLDSVPELSAGKD